MKDIVLNEAARGAELLSTCTGLEDLRASISLVARYDIQAAGVSVSEAIRHVSDYAKKAFPEVHPNHIDSIVPHYVENASVVALSKIDSVPITQRELDAITELKSNQLQRLAFSALALAKYDTMRFPDVNYWIRGDRWNEVMRRANMAEARPALRMLFHELYVAGLIGVSKKVGNNSIRVLFADEDGEPALSLTDPDYKDLGFTLRAAMGEPYRRCAECGRWIKQAKNGRKKYCDSCAADNQRALDSAYRRKKRALF